MSRVWTVSVRLKPGWSYRFMLNSDRFKAFKSQDGVPLAPVVVTFKTGKGKHKDAIDSSLSP